MVKQSQLRNFVRLLAYSLIAIAALIAITFLYLKKSHIIGSGVERWQAGCRGNQRITLTHLPMDLLDVANITPLGLTAGAHVTPIDHLYFYPKSQQRDAAPVYAMADGYIKDISVRQQSVDTGQTRPAEYRLVMQHSCQTITYFDLVTSLDPSIEKQWKAFHVDLSIPIKAGQAIGRIGGQSLDTAVYNMKLTLPGFIHPQLYEAESWKIHTDQFFDYFNDPLRAQLLELNPRKVPPLSGKIDYDQPGKLIGNWFLQGTNGYDGPTHDNDGKDGHGYWDGHLAIFYDAINPRNITISIGRFGPNGPPDAFGVAGNSPDPATVSQTAGVVKYQLIRQPHGLQPDATEHPDGPAKTVGVVLFQVLEGEKLKVEVFPDQTATEIKDFTSAAKIYER